MIFSPLVSLGYGPQTSGAILMSGMISSQASIDAAKERLKNKQGIPPARGRSSNRYENPDKSNNFSIRIGSVRVNALKWTEDKKLNYVTVDQGTVVKMKFSEAHVTAGDILIKAKIQKN